MSLINWLTGRLGAVSLAALVRHLCLRAGLPEDRIDVSGLCGAAEGYAVIALESPRASITTLARDFGFDAVETEGVIRLVMRGRAAVATLDANRPISARRRSYDPARPCDGVERPKDHGAIPCRPSTCRHWCASIGTTSLPART